MNILDRMRENKDTTLLVLRWTKGYRVEMVTKLKNEVTISRRCERPGKGRGFKRHLIILNWKTGKIVQEYRWNNFEGIASGMMIQHNTGTVIELDEIIIRRIRKYGMTDG